MTPSQPTPAVQPSSRPDRTPTRTRTRSHALLAGLALGAGLGGGLGGELAAQQFPPTNRPQPRPGFSEEVTVGGTTLVVTPQSLRPVDDNELEIVFANMFDGNGVEMLNTLPSLPDLQRPDFNLLAEEVTSVEIPEDSPITDLEEVLRDVARAADRGRIHHKAIQFGLDILEGNPIPDRVYSGLAMLHYTGPDKLKTVEPIHDDDGNVIGGNVDVHQIWFDGRIESDTSMIDPRHVQHVPWTVTYTIDVLDGGQDDFSPFLVLFDAPPSPDSFVDQGMHGPPHVGMDQVFFPMKEGERFTIKIMQPQARYMNLVYTWGWRKHPPRVQVMENALKNVIDPSTGAMTSIAQIPVDVFGRDPRASEEAKLAAIAQIGELAPAKRMWQALRDARDGATPQQVVALMEEAEEAFEDWTDRTELPRGVSSDPTADHTLFFVNNQLYGDIEKFSDFQERGATFRVTVHNGDHFAHGYASADFGGSRGWENQFEDSGGPGGSHTFGRAHWWPVAGAFDPAAAGVLHGTIAVPPVGADGTPSRVRVDYQLNFDPSDRLRIYQFDPLHHDVAVYSIH